MRISDWSSDVCSSDLPLHQLLAQRVGRLLANLQRDIGVDALPLDGVRVADDGRLGDLCVGDQRALHLGGAHAVARDVDDVVDATGDPVVAVGVAPAAVTAEVLAGIGREVRSEEHTSELQSLMRISYAVFCLKQKNKTTA